MEIQKFVPWSDSFIAYQDFKKADGVPLKIKIIAITLFATVIGLGILAVCVCRRYIQKVKNERQKKTEKVFAKAIKSFEFPKDEKIVISSPNFKKLIGCFGVSANEDGTYSSIKLCNLYMKLFYKDAGAEKLKGELHTVMDMVKVHHALFEDTLKKEYYRNLEECFGRLDGKTGRDLSEYVNEQLDRDDFSFHTVNKLEKKNLSCIPLEVFSLRNLHHLKVEGRDLVGISSEIEKLQNSLCVLEINGCYQLENLPVEIKELRKLQEINIVDCGMKEVNIGENLENLNKISLKNCEYLESLSEEQILKFPKIKLVVEKCPKLVVSPELKKRF